MSAPTWCCQKLWISDNHERPTHALSFLPMANPAVGCVRKFLIVSEVWNTGIVESFPTWQLSRNDSVLVWTVVFKDEYFMKKSIEIDPKTKGPELPSLHVLANLQTSTLYWLTSSVSFLAEVGLCWRAVNTAWTSARGRSGGRKIKLFKCVQLILPSICYKRGPVNNLLHNIFKFCAIKSEFLRLMWTKFYSPIP